MSFQKSVAPNRARLADFPISVPLCFLRRTRTFSYFTNRGIGYCQTRTFRAQTQSAGTICSFDKPESSARSYYPLRAADALILQKKTDGVYASLCFLLLRGRSSRTLLALERPASFRETVEPERRQRACREPLESFLPNPRGTAAPIFCFTRRGVYYYGRPRAPALRRAGVKSPVVRFYAKQFGKKNKTPFFRAVDLWKTSEFFAARNREKKNKKDRFYNND